MFSFLFVCVLLCVFGLIYAWRVSDYEERLRSCRMELLEALGDIDLFECITLSPHEYADRCQAHDPPNLWVCPLTGRRRRAVIVTVVDPSSDEEEEWEDEANARPPHFGG